MKTLMWLLFVCPAISAESHSLKYFYTASSGVPNFPEFVAVGYVDDIQIVHYDSNTKRAEPKQDWMSRVTEEDPGYSERQTQISLGSQQAYKANIEVVKQRFNQTGGIHIFQTMYGCEWDDETGDINGFDREGYDGEDFMAFDLKDETWVAPVQQAVITKHKMDHNKPFLAQQKHYYTQICIDWLKKYVSYRKRRTVLPKVSLLQKSPSSPVSCHATGFHPNRAVMFWRKDGEVLHEGEDHGEILPNHDGSFQMTADLKVPPEQDWDKYQCVFQLSGVQTDVITRLEKAVIRTNQKAANTMIVLIVVAVIVLVAITVLTGVFLYKKKCAKQKPSPPDSLEVSQELNPKA